ncbi:MAG: hypothetical protein H6559_03425 [Lewinellaceae bacterium]|nr:hypothetical protein [Lewinellaceae bacterium]
MGGDIDGEAVNDQSGFSVALSVGGSRVAVGARLNDGNGSNAGQVRVYDFIGGTWEQAAGDIDGEAAGNRSGWSVALSASGSRVAIGAIYNGDNGTFAGHVRAYELTLPCQVSWYDAAGNAVGTGEVFDPVAANEVDPGTPGAYSFFAECVCAGCPSARTEAVFTVALPEPPTVQNYEICPDPGLAALPAGEGLAADCGPVALSQLGLDIDSEAAGDLSGWSVALSADGSRMAVGARFNDGNGLDAGKVRVYDFIGEPGCKSAATSTARR